MATALAGIEFEAKIGARFRSLGWVVLTTPVTGDYGADLVAKLAPETLVVQCKDYGTPVGLCAIQEVHLARSFHHATAAIVVARSGFTKAARHGAAATGVVLLKPEQIAYGCSWDRTGYVKRKAEAAERKAEDAEYAMRCKRNAAERDQRYKLERSKWFQGEEQLGLSIAWQVYDLCIDEFKARSLKSLKLRIGSALKLCGPTRPSANRRCAVINCDVCSQRLRVDVGRTGHIQCPTCKVYFGVRT